MMLPENAPVRLTSAQLEELDYRKLYEAYSPKGRKSVVDPKVMFKVTAYAYECGIYSTRQMEEACKKRGYRFCLPSPIYCTDNAVMIGAAGYYDYLNGKRAGWDLNAVPNLKLGY